MRVGSKFQKNLGRHSCVLTIPIYLEQLLFPGTGVVPNFCPCFCHFRSAMLKMLVQVARVVILQNLVFPPESLEITSERGNVVAHQESPSPATFHCLTEPSGMGHIFRNCQCHKTGVHGPTQVRQGHGEGKCGHGPESTRDRQKSYS